MTILAAATVDRVKDIPGEFWMKLAIGVGALVLAVVLLRKLAKMNKVLLGVIVFLVLTFVGFNWIYERNEPTWATPVVQWLAEFFPSRGRR
jgi:apolipoprotein N-acyltransferase